MLIFFEQREVVFGLSLNYKRLNQLFVVIFHLRGCGILQISQSLDFLNVLSIVILELLLNITDLLLNLSATFLALTYYAI